VSGPLQAKIESELSSPAPEYVVRLAATLSDPARDAVILYYGSTLRTGDLSGILDFYRLTRRPHRKGARGLVERVLWPEVSYHEVEIEGKRLRAKVATLTLPQFHKASRGRTLDTTIWARFVQPTQRVWSADPDAASAATQACSAAVMTAARYAAALGPDRGVAADYWRALFRKTYATEFRVEAVSRADTVIAADAGRYEALLPLAWQAAQIGFEDRQGILAPKKQGLTGWWLVNMVGKPLNIARLTKAAFTFEGAARYAAWKVQRHTGIEITVSAFAERHPLLAAPGAWWRLSQHQAKARRERSSNP